jgi:hypothetical protein
VIDVRNDLDILAILARRSLRVLT